MAVRLANCRQALKSMEGHIMVLLTRQGEPYSHVLQTGDFSMATSVEAVYGHSGGISADLELVLMIYWPIQNRPTDSINHLEEHVLIARGWGEEYWADRPDVLKKAILTAVAGVRAKMGAQELQIPMSLQEWV